MDCIEIMVEEHKNIKRMLNIIRKYCYKILTGQPVCYEDFFKIIDFVRNYADKHHHGKEEKLLFNRMIEELGDTGEKLVRYGMLVEHDLGRLHMQELELAVNSVLSGEDEARLDIIAHAVSYAHLLSRHIDKEDNVAYQFAIRELAQETIDKINKECREFEQDAERKEVQAKYLRLLEDLEGNI
jgi:hemerythrin-like domain-containing protein